METFTRALFSSRGTETTSFSGKHPAGWLSSKKEWNEQGREQQSSCCVPGKALHFKFPPTCLPSFLLLARPFRSLAAQTQNTESWLERRRGLRERPFPQSNVYGGVAASYPDAARVRLLLHAKFNGTAAKRCVRRASGVANKGGAFYFRQRKVVYLRIAS